MTSLDDEEIIEEFVAESRDHLNSIEPDLLAMEKETNAVSADVINRIFRGIHSIKGAAGFFGFEALKNLSHAMESALMLVRDGKLTIGAALMDALFSGVDRLKVMIGNIYGSNEIAIEDCVAPLQAILQQKGIQTLVDVVDVSGGRRFQLDAGMLASARARGMKIFHITAYLHQDIQKHWGNPLAFINALLKLGECQDAFIDTSHIVGLDDCLAQDLAVSLLLMTALEREPVCLQLFIPMEQIEALKIDEAEVKTAEIKTAEVKPAEVKAAEVRPAEAKEAEIQESGTGVDKAAIAADAAPSRHGKDASSSETIRIRVDLLSNLMNLAGELVLGRNQLMRALAGEARESGLGVILQNINQVTTELQEGIMQTRMQPADTIFNRFPRIIRDMSKQLGKQIELDIQGSEVELDKSLVELLTDPLTHIIRNSADHAIEMPEERERCGKSPVGHILLRAYHQDGHVNIAIQDDGKGIDALRVRQKALEKGLITQAQAAQMTEREMVNLIFAPGFSTNDTVSELSGRGVGMDVVRSNTEKMGGSVNVETEVGKGTTILLRLPLTLAIIPSMIVGVGRQRFAIPQVHVVEFVSVLAREISKRVERIHDAEVLRLRDRLLPLVRLADVLQIPGKGQAAAAGPSHPTSTGEQKAASPPAADYNVVVVQIGTNQFGIVVDELFDIEEIVVKPPSVFAQNCKCFSGATIMGDGHVIMILDVGGLVAQTGMRFPDLQAELRRRQEVETQRAIVSASRRRQIILCTGAADEYLAIPQESILRLEMFSSASIQKVGEQEFVSYRGHGLPLIRLEKYIDVRPVSRELKDVYVVIPKIVGANKDAAAQGGIVISSIIDALEVEVKLETKHVKSAGVLGSAILQDNLTLFLNPNEILKTAGLLQGAA